MIRFRNFAKQFPRLADTLARKLFAKVARYGIYLKIPAVKEKDHE